MALRALGRLRVMTATPLGKTLPLTKSSEESAMAATQLREFKDRNGTKRVRLGFPESDLGEQGIAERCRCEEAGFGRRRSPGRRVRIDATGRDVIRISLRTYRQEVDDTRTWDSHCARAMRGVDDRTFFLEMRAGWCDPCRGMVPRGGGGRVVRRTT
ncbi:hypothetical protein GW17_00004958 [Ensete ventricosum]|nr:hypothetical protein GW17_00004958 [Ensete ventricosum]